jgi:ATP-binding cassette subfamily F protein 3
MEKEIKRIEDRIEAREKELETLNADMQAATRTGDGERIAALGQSIHQCQTEIDGLFEALEVETERLEEERRGFDEEIGKLE